VYQDVSEISRKSTGTFVSNLIPGWTERMPQKSVSAGKINQSQFRQSRPQYLDFILCVTVTVTGTAGVKKSLLGLDSWDSSG